MSGAEAILYIDLLGRKDGCFLFSAFAKYALKNMVLASDIRLMGFIPCPFFLEVPQFTISEFIHFVTRSECEKLFILWAKPKRFFILKLGQKGRLLFCFRLLRGMPLKTWFMLRI